MILFLVHKRKGKKIQSFIIFSIVGNNQKFLIQIFVVVDTDLNLMIIETRETRASDKLMNENETNENFFKHKIQINKIKKLIFLQPTSAIIYF